MSELMGRFQRDFTLQVNTQHKTIDNSRIYIYPNVIKLDTALCIRLSTFWYKTNVQNFCYFLPHKYRVSLIGLAIIVYW